MYNRSIIPSRQMCEDGLPSVSVLPDRQLSTGLFVHVLRLQCQHPVTHSSHLREYEENFQQQVNFKTAFSTNKMHAIDEDDD